MTTKRKNITIYAANTVRIISNVEDDSGFPVNLTYATILYGIFDKDGVALVSKSTNVSGDIDVSYNQFTININPADIPKETRGTYLHDLKIIFPENDSVTVMDGTVNIRRVYQ